MKQEESSSKKGLFITFEGPECAGKTTQIRILEDYLKRIGQNVLCTREPGGTALAEEIRALLLNPRDEKVSGQAELLLFSAGRAQHVQNVIRPHLEKGGIVICDRFIDSTTAYQGFARGMDMEFIDRLNAFAIDECYPDLTFLLDLPLSESRKRLTKRNGEAVDRMEAEDNKFHQAVRLGFITIAEHYPDRFRVVDATDTIEGIASVICGEVKHAIDKL